MDKQKVVYYILYILAVFLLFLAATLKYYGIATTENKYHLFIFSISVFLLIIAQKWTWW